MESQTNAGIGLFKGKSLCLTLADTQSIHKKFNQLYKNKVERDNEVKNARYSERTEQILPSQTTFSPKINEKSLMLARKSKGKSREPQRDSAPFEGKDEP